MNQNLTEYIVNDLANRKTTHSISYREREGTRNRKKEKGRIEKENAIFLLCSSF